MLLRRFSISGPSFRLWRRTTEIPKSLISHLPTGRSSSAIGHIMRILSSFRSVWAHEMFPSGKERPLRRKPEAFARRVASLNRFRGVKLFALRRSSPVQ
jgi:hypothetical protein